MIRILIIFTLFLSSSAFAESAPNYCLDPETNSTWAKMLSESPQDDLVAKLFALRIGLCELVERKAISLDRATNIFEDARAKGVSERKAELLRQQQKGGAGT